MQSSIEKKQTKQSLQFDQFNKIAQELYLNGEYSPEIHFAALVAQLKEIAHIINTEQNAQIPNGEIMYFTLRLAALLRRVKSQPGTLKQELDQFVQCDIPRLIIPVMRDFYTVFLSSAPKSFTKGWGDNSLAKNCWNQGAHLRERYLLECRFVLIETLNNTLSLCAKPTTISANNIQSGVNPISAQLQFSSACKYWLTLNQFHTNNPQNMTELTTVILKLQNIWEENIFSTRTHYFLAIYFELLAAAETIPTSIYNEVYSFINNIIKDLTDLKAFHRGKFSYTITLTITNAYLVLIKHYNLSTVMIRKIVNEMFIDRKDGIDLSEIDLKILAGIKTVPPQILPIIKNLFCAGLFNVDLDEEQIAHLATILSNNHDILLFAINMGISKGYNIHTFHLITKDNNTTQNHKIEQQNHPVNFSSVQNPEHLLSDADHSPDISGDDASDCSSSNESSDNHSNNETCHHTLNEDEKTPGVQNIYKTNRLRIYQILEVLASCPSQVINKAPESQQMTHAMIRGMLITVINNDAFNIAEKTAACLTLAKYMDADTVYLLKDLFYADNYDKFFIHAVCNALLLYEGSDSDARETAITILVELFPVTLTDIAAKCDYQYRLELQSLLAKTYKTLCQIRSFSPHIFTTAVQFLTNIISQKTYFTFPDKHAPNALFVLANIIRYTPIDEINVSADCKTALTTAKMSLLTLASQANLHCQDYDENKLHLMLALLHCKESEHFTDSEKIQLEQILSNNALNWLNDAQIFSDSIILQEAFFKIYVALKAPSQQLIDTFIKLWLQNNIIVPNSVIQKIVACTDTWQLSLINCHMYNRILENMGVQYTSYEHCDADSNCQAFYTLELINKEAHSRTERNQLENDVIAASNNNTTQPHKRL